MIVTNTEGIEVQREKKHEDEQQGKKVKADCDKKEENKM